ncbi:hypothetical protein NEA10_02670 [Phormidium yuhuli AB48]|uniref:Uncharacterized protein n=1 Tax=Phormidium yuhuli AB48 TaxID=2940671 RepID=A0ABY5AR02_9CYAN|nr:hypothetical protein [Phormidium yuhuli]USR91649.1 hypothetical protein NEA10_02670 [Phormidium yuhuli AB48]
MGIERGRSHPTLFMGIERGRSHRLDHLARAVNLSGDLSLGSQIGAFRLV